MIQLKWKQISGGPQHSIIATDGGDCYTFGNNDSGQLGNGTFERLLALSKLHASNDLLTSDNPPCSHSPVHVKEVGARVIHVSAGDRNCACIDSNGQVYTWGYNGSSTGEKGGGEQQAGGGQTGQHHVSRIGLGPPNPFLAGDIANHRVSETEWQKRANTRPRLVYFNADRPVIKNLSCGADHTLCVSTDGDTFSWGLGEFGQLGHGNVVNHDYPQMIDVLRGLGATDVACGAKHSIVVTVTGSAMSFGFGGNGRLGNGWIQGTLSPSPVEFQVNQGNDPMQEAHVFPVQVDAGEAHTAFVSRSGVAYTCGCGAYGRLGHGEEADVGIATRIDSLCSIGHVMQISCGAFHTIVLMESRELYGFGSDRYGQLGQGGNGGKRRHAKNFLAPSLIRSKITSSYNQVSCGRHHTLALSCENRVLAWGYGTDGQLGMVSTNSEDGDEGKLDDNRHVHLIGQNIFRPRSIDALLDKQVSGVSTIQMDQDGSGGGGGDGDGESNEMMGNGDENGNANSSLGDISGGHRVPGFGHLLRTSFCMVACGHLHTLALTVGGKVWAWGDNTKGQLGVHTTETLSPAEKIRQHASAAARSSIYNFHAPTLVDGSFGSSACVFIACGGQHSLGISSKSGELYTWGNGGDGQLGDGMDTATKKKSSIDNEDKNLHHSVGIPTLVSSLVLKNRKVVYVAGGEDNSAAVLEDGTLYMWGNTARGKLGCGIPKTVVVNVPHVVVFKNEQKNLNTRVVQISLGIEHTGCVDEKGRTFTWGSGYYGKLGLGHRRNVYVPEQVETLRGHPCRMISCGSKHTLAVTMAGDLFSWGRGDERLGLKDIYDGNGPNAKSESSGSGGRNNIDIPTLNVAFRDMSMSVVGACAGQNHSMVIDVDGYLWTFGKSGALDRSGHYGTLGTASILSDTLENSANDDLALVSTSVPKKVTALYDYAAGVGDGYLHLGAPSRSNTKSTKNKRRKDPPLVESFSNHCIALTTSGDVYTWGCGVYGRLGHGAESQALYHASIAETKLQNIQLSDEDMELLPMPKKPRLNPMETTARKIMSPYLVSADILVESTKTRQSANRLLEKQYAQQKSKGKRKKGRGTGSVVTGGGGRFGGGNVQSSGFDSKFGGDGSDGARSGNSEGGGRDGSGFGNKSNNLGGAGATQSTAGGTVNQGDGGNQSRGTGQSEGAGQGDRTGQNGGLSQGVGARSQSGGSGIDSGDGSGFGNKSNNLGGAGATQSTAGGTVNQGDGGNQSRGTGQSEGAGQGDRTGQNGGLSQGVGARSQSGGLGGSGSRGSKGDFGEDDTDGSSSASGGAGSSSGIDSQQQISKNQSDSSQGGSGLSTGGQDGAILDADGSGGTFTTTDGSRSTSRSSGDSNDTVQLEPELLGAGPPLTKLGRAVQSWETRRIAPSLGFVLRALNAEPSEHTETSLKKVLNYIERQKTGVHGLLVENENVEIETAEIERNIEWVVKATVGALYPDIADQAEKNSIFEEHGTSVPHDISVHSHVLELIFSLLLVNPGYLLRLYGSFVSDASRMSRKLQNNTQESSSHRNDTSNSNNSNGNVNAVQNNSKKNKKNNSTKNTTKFVPERILQHDLRFVDLVFDIYGDLEKRYSEDRFLVLCTHILQEETQGIAERTGSNFPLFAARFASGNTVFGRLAKRYLRQPHIVRAASKVLSTQLSAVLDKLTHGSMELGRIYTNRKYQNEQEIQMAPEDVDPVGETGLYTFDYNPNRVACYVDNKQTLNELDSNMSTTHMNDIFDEDRSVHSEVDRRVTLLKNVSNGIFGSVCRTCDALPSGVLILVTAIYRQIHSTFRTAIRDGGKRVLDASKLMVSKFVMDNLYLPILTSPKMHGIIGEKDYSNKSSSKKKKKSNPNQNQNNTEKTKDFSNNGQVNGSSASSASLSSSSSTSQLHTVSINLEILGDTLRHMSSTLSYNSKARWLHSLENHVQNYKTESITWATSMIRLGGLYELPRLLVDDMYRAHIDNPITICTIGLSRIQYLRYCFYMKPDALVSSKSDIMHQLLFAPQGMGLLSKSDDIRAAANFPTECEMSDHRNATGTGRVEKVSINMSLQTRYLTNKSSSSFLQWRRMSSKSMKGKNKNEEVDESKKTQEVQMRQKKWGDLSKNGGTGTSNNKKNNGSSHEQHSDHDTTDDNDSILELYLDAAASVPLPAFLSSPDAALVDTAKQMVGQTEGEILEQGNQSEGSILEAGKLALREVIRSMDSIPDKPLQALQAILSYIRKQQGLPLGLRDWSKAKRYQLAYEFLILGSGSGRGGMMNDADAFVNLMCEYLINLENRSSAADDLRSEIARLSKLQLEAETWSVELSHKKNISEEYLEELLGTSSTKSNNQKTKESLVDRGIAKKKELTNNMLIRNALEKQYGSKANDKNNKKNKNNSSNNGTTVDSRGAFRVSTLGELKSIGAISKIDFGNGILRKALQHAGGRSNSTKMFDKDIKFYFSNRSAATAGTTKTSKKKTGSDHFIVTSVYTEDFVISEFSISTDELVALNKSSLVEWRPTGSNTTFYVVELLAYMKDLQLRELLQKKK